MPLASPSSSQVQDTGLSRQQHRFKSGWGRQLGCHRTSAPADALFSFRKMVRDIPHSMGDNSGLYASGVFKYCLQSRPAALGTPCNFNKLTNYQPRLAVQSAWDMEQGFTDASRNPRPFGRGMNRHLIRRVVRDLRTPALGFPKGMRSPLARSVV